MTDQTVKFLPVNSPFINQLNIPADTEVQYPSSATMIRMINERIPDALSVFMEQHYVKVEVPGGGRLVVGIFQKLNPTPQIPAPPNLLVLTKSQQSYLLSVVDGDIQSGGLTDNDYASAKKLLNLLKTAKQIIIAPGDRT